MSAGEDTAPPGFVVSSDKSVQHKKHTFPSSGQSLTGRDVVSRSLNTSWGGKKGGRGPKMMSTWRDANVFVTQQKITSREPAGETTGCVYDRIFFFPSSVNFYTR